MKISIKYFCLLTFLMMEFTSLSCFAKIPEMLTTPISDATTTEALRIKITLYIEIGRPSRNCQGFGICDIDLSISDRVMNSGIATGSIDDYNKNLLLLEINKSTGMAAECYKKYFETGKFLVEESYSIPLEICKSLGLTSTKIIMPGSYSITERNDILYLSLPLK